MKKWTKKKWTTLDLAYIAKFYNHDGITSLAYAFDVKRSTIEAIANDMYNKGLMNKYRQMWDEIHMKGSELNGIHQQFYKRPRK